MWNDFRNEDGSLPSLHSPDVVSWDKFKNLRSLSFRNCFFRRFPHLQLLSSLKIVYCEGVVVIALDLPFLRDLFIRGCRDLTDVQLTDTSHLAKHLWKYFVPVLLG
jgi:hypothetical protein